MKFMGQIALIVVPMMALHALIGNMAWWVLGPLLAGFTVAAIQSGIKLKRAQNRLRREAAEFQQTYGRYLR